MLPTAFLLQLVFGDIRGRAEATNLISFAKLKKRETLPCLNRFRDGNVLPHELCFCLECILDFFLRALQ